MKTSSVFTNDMLELGEKEFYYSRRMVNGPFDVFKTHAHNRSELYFLLSGKRNYSSSYHPQNNLSFTIRT